MHIAGSLACRAPYFVRELSLFFIQGLYTAYMVVTTVIIQNPLGLRHALLCTELVVEAQLTGRLHIHPCSESRPYIRCYSEDLTEEALNKATVPTGLCP
jgi:hypothetical protein